MLKRKIKKTALITAITLLTLIVVIIACISPIAKYLVEKYSVKYLGREIKMGWLYLNPFTGYLHISHLRVYEANSDSLFLTADGLSAKYAIFKMLHKTYEISSISLDKPVGYIIQNRRALNFSDIIERFTPKEKRDTAIPKNPVHFNILNISVSDGEFHYIAQTIPINYYVKHVNIESTGKWWNVDSMMIKFALQSGPGSGIIKGDGAINFDNLRYSLTATVDTFDLQLMEQYLHDMSNFCHLSAFLDAQVKARGSFKDGLDLDASGFIAVSDFHFGKKPGDDFVAFDRLVIDAKQISPKNYTYFVDSVMMEHPFFEYERYDYLNNIERMFGENGSRIKQANTEYDAGKFNLIIQIARYVEKLGENFLKSYYRINKVALYNGDVKFNDFSLRDKFTVQAAPLYLIADSIDRKQRQFTAKLSTGITPSGYLSANVAIDPKNYSNFRLQYNLVKVPISIFNPYVVRYTSFPLNRGMLEFNGYMNVADSNIKSENHLLIIDPRLASRIRKKGATWLPLPLIMSLVRSSGNAIDFQIPIAGNLNNPKFKFWGAISQVLSNIFVKPPSTPYIIHEKQVEQEVEKSLSLTWLMRQYQLTTLQEKFVRRMADFLKTNPQATITITPVQYRDKEKENILLFEAKKKYFLQANHNLGNRLSEDDSLVVDKMSIKDSLFVRYLDKQDVDSLSFTIQNKCAHLIGSEEVASGFAQLIQKREAVFKGYFGDAAGRVKFNREQNTIPFNGFSFYKIDYEGQIPEALIKAYGEIGELNDEAPRKKYKEERKVEAKTAR